MPRTLLVMLLAGLVCFAAGADRRRPVRRDSSWDAGLVVDRIPRGAFGALVVDSSTRLAARWIAAPGPVDHYRLIAVDALGSLPATFVASADESSLELSGLTSSTSWSVSIVACGDPECLTTASGGGAQASTDLETWQIRGTGRGYANAAKLVPDGNTKPFPLLWGDGADAGLDGRAQLYYDPNVPSEKGIKIGTLSGVPDGTADSVAHFEPLSGFGFLRTGTSTPDSIGPATHHPVALSRGVVRMFWETALEDGRGRVFARDSADGWLGRDFHPGAPTICSTNDVRSGGACAPELIVGVEGDDVVRWPRIAQARQQKLVLPTLDDWRWDESPGTPMIVTLHFEPGVCSNVMFNAGYAVWDGANWNVDYDDAGCPKIIPGVQAPMPVHLGGSRWKLAFNHNVRGAGPGSPTKPLKLLYGDARVTGEKDMLEFEDWETIDRARDVRVLWPDGTELSVDEESRFDDFSIWMPTRAHDVQVIYSNMSCSEPGCNEVFIGMAVLVNP